MRSKAGLILLLLIVAMSAAFTGQAAASKSLRLTYDNYEEKAFPTLSTGDFVEFVGGEPVVIATAAGTLECPRSPFYPDLAPGWYGLKGSALTNEGPTDSIAISGSSGSVNAYRPCTSSISGFGPTATVTLTPSSGTVVRLKASRKGELRAGPAAPDYLLVKWTSPEAACRYSFKVLKGETFDYTAPEFVKQKLKAEPKFSSPGCPGEAKITLIFAGAYALEESGGTGLWPLVGEIF